MSYNWKIGGEKIIIIHCEFKNSWNEPVLFLKGFSHKSNKSYFHLTKNPTILVYAAIFFCEIEVGMNRFSFFKALSYLKVIGQATLDFKSKGIKPALALMFKSSLVISFLKSDFNLCTAIN